VPVPLTVAPMIVEPAEIESGEGIAIGPGMLPVPTVVPVAVTTAPAGIVRIVAAPGAVVNPPTPTTTAGVVVKRVPAGSVIVPVSVVDPVTVAVPVTGPAKVRPVAIRDAGPPPRVKVPPRLTGPVMVHVMAGGAGC